MTGTITSFDPFDGLGWLELDDGRRVRFGLTACGKFAPSPGMRVRVEELRDERGSLRAGSVRLARGQSATTRRAPRLLGRFDSARPDGGDEAAPAAFLVRWLVQHDLVSEKIRASAEDAIARVKRGEMTGRRFITEVFDEKLKEDDLAPEGLRFWLYYQGRPRFFSFFRSRYEKDLMRLCAVDAARLFRLAEADPHTGAILEQIGGAYRDWCSDSTPT